MARDQSRKAGAAAPVSALSDVVGSARARRRRVRDAVAATATPERLLRAGGAARVESFSESVEVDRGGRVVTEARCARRIRIEDDPLARLKARGLLAVGPDSAARSASAGAAGERYRHSWHSAGLQPLRSLDIAHERVSGAQGGLLRTERQIDSFHAFGRATAVMPLDVRRVVDAVVLHERDPADIGRELSGYRQDKQATAVALYLLRAGLATLAVHYGLLRAPHP